MLVSRYKNLSAFADAIGRTHSNVSRFLGKNPTRGIGNKIAREIENVCDKPHGWLDTYHEAINERDESKECHFEKLSPIEDQQAVLSSKAIPAMQTSYAYWTRITELEQQAAALLAEAENEQVKMEKKLSSDVEQVLTEKNLSIEANVYRNSFDMNHPKWKRIVLHMPYKNECTTIYEHDLDVINPDAIFIAIPRQLSSIDLFVIEKPQYSTLLGDFEPAPGIHAIEINYPKKTVNDKNLFNFLNLNHQEGSFYF